MTNQLAMELRTVEIAERVVVGIVVPYDETSYLTPDPAGERILRGAFTRSIQHRGGRIPLLVGHNREKKMGTSRAFRESDDGLVGEFVVNPGPTGDAFLAECRDGYYGALSAGFAPVHSRRGADGAREVTEGKLVEVSALAVPAYEGAAMLAVRSAQDLDVMLAPFRARPDVNLSPIPPLVYRSG
jgi:HK97 family phage prohead protease